MADDEGHYSPPPLVFDADEATAVTQPLLAETDRGDFHPNTCIVTLQWFPRAQSSDLWCRVARNCFLFCETGQTESKQDSAQPDQAARETQAVHIPPQYPASADQRYTASHTPEYTAPTGLDLTSLPDGIATWHEQRGLQILWLLSSIFMVMLDVVGLDVGFLAGLLGIIGSSLAVCNCFQGMDLRSIVKVRQKAGHSASNVQIVLLR